MKALRVILFLWASLCVATCAFAQEHTLEWDSLTVAARLDAKGTLHVTERHAMVFNGAWIGGERTFQVRPWQSLTLSSVREIDPSTQLATPMQKGDLSHTPEVSAPPGTVTPPKAKSQPCWRVSHKRGAQDQSPFVGFELVPARHPAHERL